MPFELKIVGAMNQRLVNKIFKDQVGKTMKVYVDDMLTKSLRVGDHIIHIRNTFNVI